MEENPSELVAELGSADWKRRDRAYHALLGMGKAAVPDLLSGMRHSDWRVRATSVALMDHVADERCLEALSAAVKDDSLHVRRHVAHALACQACKPAPLCLDVVGMLLELTIHDPSIQVRRVATANLVLLEPDPRVAKALYGMIPQETDDKLVRRAQLALRHHAAAV